MTSLLDRITINPEISHGKPTIRGLRYPVETILELLSSDMTIEEILADFVNSYLLPVLPYKLLVVSTGNITNTELEALFVPNIPVIVTALQTNNNVELTRTTLIIHG